MGSGRIGPLAASTWRALLTALLAVSLSACLGTRVESTRRPAAAYRSTRIHIIGSWSVMDAQSCQSGLSSMTSWVPLWGVAVGILTFGILIPMTSEYVCAAGGSGTGTR
jgi:hypothetical protein